MLGIDGIQKVYGSNNSLIPSAIMAFVRNTGLAFCQSPSLLKVCIYYYIYLYLHIIFTLLFYF